jgi:hypothetical protein
MLCESVWGGARARKPWFPKGVKLVPGHQGRGKARGLGDPAGTPSIPAARPAPARTRR